MRFKWFSDRRRKKPSLFYFTKLASEAGEVITARTKRGLKGTLSPAEAHRMVAEKQAAALNACFAFTKHAMRGEMAAASAASFNIFKKAVSSNHRRLRRQRKRR